MDRPQHMPADTPDYMAQAWVDCLRWAVCDKGVIAAFAKETGATVETTDGPDAFIVWFNEKVWGCMDILSRMDEVNQPDER